MIFVNTIFNVDEVLYYYFKISTVGNFCFLAYARRVKSD